MWNFIILSPTCSGFSNLLHARYGHEKSHMLCSVISCLGGWNKLAPPLNISSSGPMRCSLHLVPPSKQGKTLGDGRDGRKPTLKVTLPSCARAKISHKNGNTSLGVLFKFSISIARRAVGRTTELELVYSFISTFLFIIFFRLH